MAEVQEAVIQPKPQRSWFGRNWWWVLLIVLVGGGVVCCGVCGFFGYFGIQTIKKSEPYQMTLSAVRSDPTVIDRLGEPIADDWKVNLQMNDSGSTGNATVMVPISGPKGTADVRSELRKVAGRWGLTAVEVTFSDGQRHVLPLAGPKPEGDAGEAPRFVPPGEVPQNPESP